MLKLFSRLGRNQKAAAAVEFAIIAPAFLTILMGGFDISHTLYTKAILQGEVQKAARDLSLETGAVTAQQNVIDARVRTSVLNMNKSATVTITRQFFQSFTGANSQFEDVSKDGVCTTGETWFDLNGNGVFDNMNNSTGQGAAKDAVRYSVTMTYPHLFPVVRLIGMAPTVTINATTVYANQPYSDQAVRTGTTTARTCP